MRNKYFIIYTLSYEKFVLDVTHFSALWLATMIFNKFFLIPNFSKLDHGNIDQKYVNGQNK